MNDNTKKRNWTQEEEQFIVENYENMTNKRLAEELNRSASSIAGKKLRLGLKGGAVEDITAKLTGGTFGHLTVIRQSKTRLGKDKRVAWDCVCVCGNTTIVTTSELNGGGTKSCGCRKSAIIAGNTYGQLTTIRPTDERKWGNVVWECECSCGKKHFADAGNLRRGNIKSCGCSVTDRANVRGKKFNRIVPIELVRRRGKERIYWKCLCECGNETIVQTSDIVSGRIKSCGCLQSELVTGPNSRFYNPGLTAEDRLINNRYVSSKENVSRWRKHVYEKDGYACQKCGVRGGELNAHHMDAWHWCKERRFDISNGVTLCVRCHKQFHYTYGNKNNSEEQFKEYQEK